MTQNIALAQELGARLSAQPAHEFLCFTYGQIGGGPTAQVNISRHRAEGSSSYSVDVKMMDQRRVAISVGSDFETAPSAAEYLREKWPRPLPTAVQATLHAWEVLDLAD